MGGISHDSLKVASALNVEVLEIPTSVVVSEICLVHLVSVYREERREKREERREKRGETR